MTFFDDVMELLEKEPGPIEWKRFAVLGMISGLLERRVWLPYGAKSATWPNLFLFIVGRAGSGKSQVLKKVKDLVLDYNQSKVSPKKVSLCSDKVNGATFLEELINSYDPIEKQSPLFILQDEMGALFQDFGAVTFATDLLKYFDCPKEFSKRTRGQHEVAQNVSVALLTGTTKNFLKRYLPSENRGDGLVSRGIFIHRPTLDIKEKFSRAPITEEVDQLYQRIVMHDIPRMLRLKGKMSETKEAFDYLEELSNSYGELQYQQPEGSVLDGYFARKSMQVIKLGMCLAASEFQMEVRKEHYELADKWLTECEPYMNEIFSTSDMKHNKEATANLLDGIPRGAHNSVGLGKLMSLLAQMDSMMPDSLQEVMVRLEVLEKMNLVTCARNTEGIIVEVFRN